MLVSIDLLGALALLVVVLFVLSLFMIGIPIAIWLLIRWAFLAQTLVLEDLKPLRVLRRSSQLVAGGGGRWRRFKHSRQVSLLLGPLVGVGLLFATTATFDVPFAAIATTYLYFDCKVHEQLDPVEEKRTDALPAEI